MEKSAEPGTGGAGRPVFAADPAGVSQLLDQPQQIWVVDLAHVRLVPVTDGDMTFWHWESRFDTPPGRERELERTVGEDIYEGGFRAVRAFMGLPEAPARGGADA